MASLYVVIFHAGVVLRDRLATDLDSWLVEAGHRGVEFFFVLSGFIMLSVHRRDLGHPEKFVGYASKRILRIFPLFWVALALLVISQAALHRLEAVFFDPVAVLQAVLLLPFRDYPPLTVAWTLSHELFFYAMFGICILHRTAGAVVLFLWWLACLASFSLEPSSLPFPISFVVSPYNLLFGIGMLVAATFHGGFSENADKIFLTGVISFALALMADAQLPERIAPLAFGVSGGLLILGAVWMERDRGLTIPRWAVFLGDASYSIYLVHTLAQVAVAIAINRMGLPVSPWFLFSALVAAGIASGAALHVGVERPLLRRLARLWSH